MNALRVSKTLKIGNVVLIAIERSCFFSERSASASWFYGSKEPVALVVHEGKTVRALSVGAETITLEALKRDIPELEAILERVTNPASFRPTDREQGW